ncbi:MAG: hypothetical protein V4662_07505 [Verrucomicrobiota bacterium]
MNPEQPALPPPLPASRSLLVTLAGWLLILIGALLLFPFLFAVASILTGGYGSKTFELSGFIIIILGPWICFATGIGLIQRWRWSILMLYVMLLWLLVASVMAIARGPQPERKYISESGVPTTVMASEVSSTELPSAVVGGVLLLIFLTRRIRSEF